MKDSTHKVMALASVLVVLFASSACAFAVPDREESDGFAVTGATIAIVAGSLLVGGAVGWFAHDMLTSDDTDVRPYLRAEAANGTTNTIKTAVVFTDNAEKNYEQAWSFSKEHWIRQAELGAYQTWTAGAEYDPSEVLGGSMVYANHSAANANAVAQFNSFMGEMSRLVSEWSGNSTYGDGNMEIVLTAGSQVLRTTSYDMGGYMASYAEAVGESKQVYIGSVSDAYIGTTVIDATDYRPGFIYADTDSSITDGTRTFSFLAGQKYFLSDLEGFADGIFTMSPGSRIAGDSLAQVVKVPGTVDLKACIILSADGETLMSDTDSEVSVRVIPHDAVGDAPGAVSLTPVLQSYGKFLVKLRNTEVSASEAAESVWQMYSQMSDRSAQLTTLVNSNNYDGTVLSEGMNRAMMLSAVGQLADYWKAHEGDLSNMDLSLYGSGQSVSVVRGNISDDAGNVLYTDVFFTPFFQTDDVSMTAGEDHTVGQTCLVSIWAKASGFGDSFTAWKTAGMPAQDSTVVAVGEGYVFSPTGFASFEGDSVTPSDHADFTVNKVRWIAPGNVDPASSVTPEDHKTDWLSIVIIAAGLLLILYGIVTRNLLYIVLGVGVVCFAAFFGGMIWKQLGGPF